MSFVSTGGRDDHALPVLFTDVPCRDRRIVLEEHQDLAFDRAHGLRSIPVRFGVARSLLISRAMHVITIICLAVLGPLADLGWIYGAGVAGVALLLVYEQSLIREHDLSQVKRAFDLNGYVGILYLVSTAVAIYVG